MTEPVSEALVIRREALQPLAKPLRILLLSRHIRGRKVVPIDRGGGTESFISSLLDLPAEISGLEIDVVAPLPEGGSPSDPPGVRVHSFSAGALVKLLFVFRNARNPIANVLLLFAGALVLAWNGLKQTRTKHYDVVYAVGGPIAGLAGILVKTFARLPLVMHFHFLFAFSRSNRLMRLLAKHFYERADAIIGNCSMFAQDCIALGVSATKCFWVLNWIDQSHFKPRNDRVELRRKLNIRDDQIAFLFAGRFDWSKHVDRLLDALREFQTPERAVFLFVGNGELQAELDTLARANPKVRVLETIPSKDLVELHNACDVLLWGSRDLDYPSLVVMEAMSSGLPVVTSSQTFNHHYEGEAVDRDVLGDPTYARHYPPTREGIRRAITETVEGAFLRVGRDEVASFARERFGISNATKLVGILSDAALKGAR